MATKNIVEKFIQNGIEIEIPKSKIFAITEDMVDVSTNSTKGVSPYNTSYGYTNITIDANCGIEWIEGALYIFVISTKLVVASAYRNVRIRIGTTGDWKPLMGSSSGIMAGSSYFTKGRTDIYIYKSTYQVNGALHLNNDTSYSAMSVAEGKTGTATSGRVVRADYLKQIIEYHAGNLHDTTKQDKLTAGEGISIENNVISATSTSAGNMNCITNFGRTRRFGTKAMFKALTEKDVNGVYVILSEKDYQKMIND